MGSQAERVLNGLRRASDALALVLAFAGAFWLRFLSGLLPPAPGAPPWEAYAQALPVVLLLGLVAFDAAGLYRRRATEPWRDEALALLRGCGLVLLVVFAATFLYRQESYSRLFALAFAGLLPASAAALRAALRAAARAARGERRLVLVGSGPPRDAAARALAAHAGEGLELVATLDTSDPDVAGRVRALGADEVLVAVPLEGLAVVRDLDRALGDVRVDGGGNRDGSPRVPPPDLRVVLDLSGLTALRPEAGALLGVPVLALRQGPHAGLSGAGKRAFDVAAAAALLVLAAPLLLLIAALVRLTSPGPALFRQERVGWGGRRFVMLKFRTMRQDAAGPTRTQRGDPRCTPLGALLRRTSLDELPQLWNVLLGDMSLVGPRPERVEHFPELERQLPGFMLRHAVPAGMTGWAQVHGLRGDAPVSERLRYDLEYIQRWSAWLDLKILLLTAVRGFAHPNAF